jgi:hypothetical protein
MRGAKIPGGPRDAQGWQSGSSCRGAFLYANKASTSLFRKSGEALAYCVKFPLKQRGLRDLAHIDALQFPSITS